MKNLRFSTVLFAVVVAFSSCKKNQYDTPLATISFPKQALAYAQLPLNRYFIYKDTATGNLDSVVVTQSTLSSIMAPAYNSTSLFGSPSHPAYYYEQYKLVLTKLNATQTSWYNVSATANPNSRYNIKSDSSRWLSLDGYDNFMTANSTIGGLGFYYDISNPGSLQSLSVEGNKYENVLQCGVTTGRDSDTAQSWYYKSSYYWVKGIGIIKRTVRTNIGTFTANLLRYGG